MKTQRKVRNRWKDDVIPTDTHRKSQKCFVRLHHTVDNHGIAQTQLYNIIETTSSKQANFSDNQSLATDNTVHQE